MNLDDYRRPTPTRLRLYFSLLLMLVLTAIVGKKREGDLGTVETLKRSSFARIMFMDIGALSTLGALYLALNGKSRVRIPAAVASLAVGSFSLLPALAYEDWKAMQNAKGEKQGPKR